MNKEKTIRSYGLDIRRERAESQDSDWVFGSNSGPCIAIIPESEREGYLPQGEVQRTAKDDMMDCASRGPLNILEAKFTYLYATGGMTEENARWLMANGYFVDGKIVLSDAFVAINAKTTRQGNSLKAPLEAIRKQGLIPKAMLPLEAWMSFEDYHNPTRITDQMIRLGKDFLERFVINYEKVYEVDFPQLLEADMLDVAGFAWPEPIDGEYPRSAKSPNHCFVNFNKPCFLAFDNYRDSFDGDFIKKLASNYDFMEYAYRIYISKEVTVAQRISWLSQWASILVNFLTFKKAAEKVIEEKKTENKPMTKTESPAEILYRVAKSNLGKDVTPNDVVADEVACAETVNAIHKQAFGDEIGGGASTFKMWEAIKKRKDFVEVSGYEVGAIIISPTGTRNRETELTHGHVGICGNHQIMSNNSLTGIWDTYFTKEKWEKYYRDKGAYPIYYYRKVA